MDETIIRALKGVATDAERRGLDEWRRASADNERRYQEIAAVWRLTGGIGTASRPETPPPPPPVAAILRRAAARPSRTRVARWPLATAAAAVLAVAAWVWMAAGPAGRPSETYATADAPLTVTLADGSFVRLAPASQIEFRESAAERVVRMEGGAFFAVAHDAARPFAVDVGDARTTVLGTRFAVERRADSVRVVVVDGMVALSNGKGTVRIGRGGVGVAVPGSPPSDTTVADVLSALAWPALPLLYHDTPLWQVAGEFSRHYGRAVTITDSALASRPVTARFDGEDFGDALAAICVIVRARCRLDATPAEVAP